MEFGVDKNTTVVFPAPLMSTISELGAFLARETASAKAVQDPPVVPLGTPVGVTAPLPAGTEQGQADSYGIVRTN
ncbi:hypothetical protein ART_0359 [Arthrobacter sp. PAMC 25486]|uniref:hypothetical protein n=1 Tax=Arthrobacter sp. PAMC 25486 TaxID=1494608 RepID=UPI0005360FAB|nr:hypothetical protein [Arthrobacter sp. PAMC 25486]AIX99957.1 hypothetical protein ART_0359 [Arthrobacter sp. PAMC 25486]